MGKWEVVKNGNTAKHTGGASYDIVEHGDGCEPRLVAWNLAKPDAEQIVREHNAHESLLTLARRYRRVTYERYTRTHRATRLRQYRAVIDELDAVLARAV
jgi:hypothetical protein